MKLKLLLMAMILLAIASCKKDNSNQYGTITFTLNGTSKSFSVYSNSLVDLDTLGIQEKTLALGSPGVLGGPLLNSGIAVIIEQNLSLPGSTAFALGAYRDAAFNASCSPDTGILPSSCSAFYFYYFDPTLGPLSPSHTDSAGYLYLTAFSNTTNQVSGNFSCQMSDTLGHLYPVTNGLFTNVTFVTQ